MFYLLKVYSVVSLGLMQCSREDATYIQVYQYIGQWFLLDETYIKGIENPVDVHLNEYVPWENHGRLFLVILVICFYTIISKWLLVSWWSIIIFSSCFSNGRWKMLLRKTFNLNISTCIDWRSQCSYIHFWRVFPPNALKQVLWRFHGLHNRKRCAPVCL